uniref:pentapeptide repeat-containing protein n=1 Tax=Agathobacter sp. TaxID=2021311 RepID=UPI0040570416
MYKLGEVFSKLELQSACNLLNTIVPLEPLRDETHSFKGNGKKYGNEFNGSLMRTGMYYDCIFADVNFYGTAGNNSVFDYCNLENCKIIDANFKYSKFTNSELSIHSEASTYDYSDFSDATVSQSSLDSSSFTECYFNNTTFKDFIIKNCEFKSSLFINCTFANIDFSMATFDYAEFDNSIFDNVTLPFFGILNLIRGFDIIVNQKNIFFKAASSNYVVSSYEYINIIRQLKPVFFYENNFLALANIYTYDGEIQNAYASILNGLEVSCKTKNFSMIHHLCRFASLNNYFTSKQLKEFYKFIEENLNVYKLGYVEYHNYLNELYLAKKLLIDCPHNRDIMEINIQATFCYKDHKKLMETLRLIDLTLEEYAPNSTNHITIRHNSPPSITIILSDNIYILYLAFLALQLVLCKSLNGIEKIQNLIRNKNEIKLQKLDEELKKLEIQKKKLEIEQESKESPSILLPRDFKEISYIVDANGNWPQELRKM